MNELSKKTQGEIPAQKTLEYMQLNSERMANFENRMGNIEKKIDKIDGKFDKLMEKIEFNQEKFGEFARDEHTKIYNQIRDDRDKVEAKICVKADGEQLIFLRNLVIYSIIASIFVAIVVSSLISYLSKR